MTERKIILVIGVCVRVFVSIKFISYLQELIGNILAILTEWDHKCIKIGKVVNAYLNLYVIVNNSVIHIEFKLINTDKLPVFW